MKTFKSPAIHRTPLYRAKSAYCGMLARCLNRNGRNPSYASVELRMTQEQWLAWAVPEYERFLRDNPDDCPNAARIGDKGHYELGNIRIISRYENIMGQANRNITMPRPDGTKLCSMCKVPKPVDCYNKYWRRADGLDYYCRDCRREKNGSEPRVPVEIKHGTDAGYAMERYRGIPHCEECLRGHREKTRATRDKMKQKLGS